MHIMFVCTGNICRSPMGELLLTRYLSGTTVQVSSAGTHGLPMHQIDPNSALLMESVGIDESATEPPILFGFLPHWQPSRPLRPHNF